MSAERRPPRKTWRTLRVIVEVRAPEGTYTEKDLAWAVKCNVGTIDHLLRKHVNAPMSLIAVKQFGKVAARGNAEGRP